MTFRTITPGDPLEAIPVLPEEPVIEPEVVRILRKARALIERPYGWCRGSYVMMFKQGTQVRPAFAVCSVGAIAVADNSDYLGCGTYPYSNEGKLALRELAQTIGALDTNYVPKWNDAQGRTKREVLAAFDETIERLLRRSRRGK